MLVAFIIFSQLIIVVGALFHGYRGSLARHLVITDLCWLNIVIISPLLFCHIALCTAIIVVVLSLSINVVMPLLQSTLFGRVTRIISRGQFGSSLILRENPIISGSSSCVYQLEMGRLKQEDYCQEGRFHDEMY